jgi:alpha-beta hydrolase superfamily lysophospholipase
MGDINYLEQYEHDLEDLNKHISEKYSVTTVFLGGHSSGAGLALKYGDGKYLPFDGYLLLAPYLGYSAPTVKPNSGGWVQVVIKRYIGLTMFNRVGIKTFNGLPVLYFNRPNGWNDSLQADSYSYRLNESFSPQNFAENLQNNKSPMLVLVGNDDDAFYPEEFEPVFSKYAPQAKVQLVAGSKHLDLPDSDIAFKIISKWLKSHK